MRFEHWALPARAAMDGNIEYFSISLLTIDHGPSTMDYQPSTITLQSLYQKSFIDKHERIYLYILMKKMLVAIIAILYMGMSSGIAMDIHYCMGKMAGAEFYGGANEKCSKCGMKEKKGCCKDDHQFYKISDSHKTVSNDIQLDAPFLFITRLFLPFISGTAVDVNQLSLKNHSPPQYSGPSVRLLQSLFRI